jgi:hypothetical protein
MAIRGIRHFVQYVDKILMAQHIAIILEIADGTLEASIDAKQKVDAELAKRMVSQMVAAHLFASRSKILPSRFKAAKYSN